MIEKAQLKGLLRKISTYLIAMLFVFRCCHLWFISSNRCCNITASSWLARLLSKFLPLALRELKTSRLFSISNWMSWNKMQKKYPRIRAEPILASFRQKYHAGSRFQELAVRCDETGFIICVDWRRRWINFMDENSKVCLGTDHFRKSLRLPGHRVQYFSSLIGMFTSYLFLRETRQSKFIQSRWITNSNFMDYWHVSCL